MIKQQCFIIIFMVSVFYYQDVSMKKAVSKLNLQDNPPRIPRVKYVLYRRSNRDGYVLNSRNALPAVFDRNQETFVLLHGMMSSYGGECMQRLKNALLDRGDYNVLIPDYSRISMGYITVYQYIARELGTFLTRNRVQEARTTFIGGSMGAQVAGMLRRQSSFKTRDIIGLDPAGPGFDGLDDSLRLSPQSADYVLAVHSNAGRWGSAILLGHDDAFINGGNNYPCCPNDLCNHRGACDFFIRTIQNGPARGRLCTNLEQARRNSCSGSDASIGFGQRAYESANRRVIHVSVSTCMANTNRTKNSLSS